ncbi:MAG: hypothetical protein IJ104_02095, partial [Methanobrevibacter sp.]|nr:hypothetical protein [Methanobrevibacter sp.]
FSGCSGLTSVDLSLPSATKWNNLFNDCQDLTTITIICNPEAEQDILQDVIECISDNTITSLKINNTDYTNQI